MVSDASSFKHIDLTCINSLGLTPISSLLLHTIPSRLRAIHESQGDIGGYNPFFNPYCVNLEDVYREIMLNTFFDHAF